MRRIDLRGRKDLFADMAKEIENMYEGEVVIVIFEIGDFSNVDKSYEFVHEQGCELLNSLKWNQADWEIVFKKGAKNG